MSEQELTTVQKENRDILRRMEQKGILSHVSGKFIMHSVGPSVGKEFKKMFYEQNPLPKNFKVLPINWDGIDIKPIFTEIKLPLIE